MILHTLLLITTLSTQSVDVASSVGSLSFNLPSPPQGVEYHSVEVWANGSQLEVRDVGDNHYIVQTNATRGTITYIRCDDVAGLCMPVTEHWDVGGPKASATDLLLVAMMFLAMAALACRLWRHDLL